MSYTPITGTGDGTPPVVNLTFPFLGADDIVCQVLGEEVAFTWTGPSQITFNAAVADGVEYLVFRRTPDEPLLTFVDTTVLTAKDLNLLQSQLIYRQQEAEASRPDAPTFQAVLRGDLAAETGGNMISFKQSGVGAVLRTMLEKSRDVVNAKDYGAIGDGVTDNGAALAAAVTAARGKRLSIPKGNYVINADVTSILVEECLLEAEGVLDGATASLDEGVNFLIKGTTNSPFKFRRGPGMRGITIFYPEQVDSAAPTAYPPTIDFDFTNGAVQHVAIVGCNVVNAYDFIRIDNAGGAVGHVNITDNVICSLRRDIFLRHNAEHLRIRGNNFTFGHWLAATEAGAAGFMRANGTALEVERSDGVEFVDNLVFGKLNGLKTSATGLCQFMNVSLNKFDQVRYPVRAVGTGNFDGVIIGNTFNSFNSANTALQGRSISIETTGTALEGITILGNAFDLATEEHVYASGDTATRKIVIGENNWRSWAAYKSSGLYGAINANGAVTNLQVTGGWFYGGTAYTKGIVGTLNTAQVTGATFDLTVAAVDLTSNTVTLSGNRSYVTSGPTSDIVNATDVRSSGNAWDKPSGVGKHAFVARSGAQTFNSGSATDVGFSTELLDTDNTFATPSFTVKAPGLYQFNWILTHDATVTVGDRWNLALVVNDFPLHDPTYRVDSAEVRSISGSYMVRLAAGDVVKLQMRRTAGTGQFVLIAPALNANSFSGTLVN